jgi:DNA-binding CsgD family transcriptional regulator
VLDGRKYRLVPLDGDGTPSPGLPPPAVVSPERAAPAEVLTARELQIVALVADGRPNKQIAAELGISEWTVSTHLRRIYAKLDVDTRAAMVSRCYGAISARETRPGD